MAENDGPASRIAAELPYGVDCAFPRKKQLAIHRRKDRFRDANPDAPMLIWSQQGARGVQSERIAVSGLVSQSRMMSTSVNVPSTAKDCSVLQITMPSRSLPRSKMVHGPGGKFT
jgi:hypothetical protein